MAIRVHLQWLKTDETPTARYRFFYAQEDDIGVEAVLNEELALQVGMLIKKDSEYIYPYAYSHRLLNTTELSSGEYFYDKFVYRYDNASLEKSLILAAEGVTRSTQIPLAQKVIQENMQTIIRSIQNFLQPYTMMDKDFTRVHDIFPERQLYTILHATSDTHGISSEKVYFVKSKKGLPYTLIERKSRTTLSTAFGEYYLTSISVKNDSHLVSAVAFPEILKPKKLFEYPIVRNVNIRVSFAKINDFNPCLIREEIRNFDGQEGYYNALLTVAPFPTLAFHKYLKGEIELPEDTKKWILRQ